MTGEDIESTGTCRVAVLGAGAWGTALACVLARKGHDTILWGRESAHVASLAGSHENARYLPGIPLPPSLAFSDRLDAACDNARIVLAVTPAQTMRALALRLDGLVRRDVPVILCAKGIDRDTGMLPAETFARALPGQPVAALSGPSFAHDVARDLPTAVTLAHGDAAEARRLAGIVSGAAFRVYASDDLKGVELGGALKNVIALAVGVCRGMGLGASAEAALIARGFAELTRLATALGARPNTLMGLSGLGDLVLTCSGTQSRNFRYGHALGTGEDTSALPLAEGALTASVALRLGQEHSIEVPIIEAVANLVAGTITPGDALRDLLARPLKSESEA